MTFDQLKRADYKFPTVALFYGRNCAPCERLKPKLREVCKSLGARLEEFAAHDEMDTVRELGLRAVPTVLLVHKGDVKIVFSGEVPDVKPRLLAAGVPEMG